MWLLLRPLEGLVPRATADVDLGIDRKGLGLTARSERVRPLLVARGYQPLPGDEGFRFEKRFGANETLLVDLFVAKGASRDEPPILERDLTTLAAPGLSYALERDTVFVEVGFVDAERTMRIELPLPTLDAAFVLKGALAASGLRTRPDRVDRDRIDAVLAAACLHDEAALGALAAAAASEAKKSLGCAERASGSDPAGGVEFTPVSDGSAGRSPG